MINMKYGLLVAVALLMLAFAAFSHLASAYDPSPLQDFCVAIKSPISPAFLAMNGKFCKDPKLVTANDFFFSGLRNPGNTENPLRSKVTLGTVDQIPGLNTMGISLARIDYGPHGLNPPHTHPRATEILACVEGSLYVGFVTSNADDNRLFAKVLNPGEVFVFPIGLLHFQLNMEKSNAVAYSSFSSQNPGVITIANGLLGSYPLINPDVLAKAFQMEKNVVNFLQKQPWPDN